MLACSRLEQKINRLYYHTDLSAHRSRVSRLASVPRVARTDSKQPPSAFRVWPGKPFKWVGEPQNRFCPVFNFSVGNLNARRSVPAPATEDARTATHSVHTLATREGHAHPAGTALTQAAAATARPKASCDKSEGPCGCNWRDQSPRSPRERRERALRVATRGAVRAGGDSCDRLPTADHDAPCGRT